MSSPKSEDSSRRGPYTLPPRRDRDDKDSGYVGSEASRKTNIQPDSRYVQRSETVMSNTIFYKCMIYSFPTNCLIYMGHFYG